MAGGPTCEDFDASSPRRIVLRARARAGCCSATAAATAASTTTLRCGAHARRGTRPALLLSTSGRACRRPPLCPARWITVAAARAACAGHGGHHGGGAAGGGARRGRAAAGPACALHGGRCAPVQRSLPASVLTRNAAWASAPMTSCFRRRWDELGGHRKRSLTRGSPVRSHGRRGGGHRHWRAPGALHPPQHGPQPAGARQTNGPRFMSPRTRPA